MAGSIHPTAIVDSAAEIGDNVSIGPYAIIQNDVVIGDNCQIGSHVLIAEGTRMGSACRVFHGASVGEIPQDLKFAGEKTLLKIGNNTTIREFCTLNRGTSANGETRIGSNCLLMAYCHIGHDCVIGDYFVGANSVNLAGHIVIGDHVGFGGICAVVQFRSIGSYSYISAFSCIIKDIVPFALVGNAPLRVVDINKVGLDRNGFDDVRKRRIRKAYKKLFREKLLLEDAILALSSDYGDDPDIQAIIASARNSKFGLLTMGNGAVSED